MPKRVILVCDEDEYILNLIRQNDCELVYEGDEGGVYLTLEREPVVKNVCVHYENAGPSTFKTLGDAQEDIVEHVLSHGDNVRSVMVTHHDGKKVEYGCNWSVALRPLK